MHGAFYFGQPYFGQRAGGVPSVVVTVVDDHSNADLMGLNGQEAWENAVLDLVAMQSRSMVGQLTVFGVAGTNVINTGGNIMVSNR